MNYVKTGRHYLSRRDINRQERKFPASPDLFLDSEPEVIETAAEGLPFRGSQMDATMHGSDGSGKYKSVLEFLAVGQLPTASI